MECLNHIKFELWRVAIECAWNGQVRNPTEMQSQTKSKKQVAKEMSFLVLSNWFYQPQKFQFKVRVHARPTLLRFQSCSLWVKKHSAEISCSYASNMYLIHKSLSQSESCKQQRSWICPWILGEVLHQTAYLQLLFMMIHLRGWKLSHSKWQMAEFNIWLEHGLVLRNALSTA